MIAVRLASQTAVRTPPADPQAETRTDTPTTPHRKSLKGSQKNLRTTFLRKILDGSQSAPCSLRWTKLDDSMNNQRPNRSETHV